MEQIISTEFTVQAIKMKWKFITDDSYSNNYSTSMFCEYLQVDKNKNS